METKAPSVGQKNWLTVPETAEDLRIPRTRCYELIQRGELPAVRIGSEASALTAANLRSSYSKTGE
jgi:excisionase family DNA binding protein